MLEELGCEKLAMVAYSVRHGGPSLDFTNIYRHLEEIQQKRQWRSSESVLRHQKSSNLWSVMHLVKEPWVPLATGYEDNLKRFVDDRTGDGLSLGCMGPPFAGPTKTSKCLKMHGGKSGAISTKKRAASVNRKTTSNFSDAFERKSTCGLVRSLPTPHRLTDVDGRDVDVPRLYSLSNC